MFSNQETPWKNELDRNRMAELPRSSVGNWPYQATLAHSNINLRKSLRLVIYNEGFTLGYIRIGPPALKTSCVPRNREPL